MPASVGRHVVWNKTSQASSQGCQTCDHHCLYASWMAVGVHHFPRQAEPDSTIVVDEDLLSSRVVAACVVSRSVSFCSLQCNGGPPAMRTASGSLPSKRALRSNVTLKQNPKFWLFWGCLQLRLLRGCNHLTVGCSPEQSPHLPNAELHAACWLAAREHANGTGVVGPELVVCQIEAGYE